MQQNTGIHDRPESQSRFFSRFLITHWEIAKEAEVEHSQTLTGFKWIILEAYRDPTKRTVFSYEEALGYAVCDSVRDKDGISAALLFIEMAEDLAREKI